MLNGQLAQKYAQAVYELAVSKGMLDKFESELRSVRDAIEGHKELASFFYHPMVPQTAKKETMLKLFGGEVDEYIMRFMLLLVDKRREMLLGQIVDEYVSAANKARNMVVAEVTAALPLTEDEQRALADKLSAVTGKRVVLKTHIDRAILGGIVVKIGDKLIDGSVAYQLRKLKQKMLTPEVNKNWGDQAI